ncbi:hypothetical protein [Serratia fonticola]|uniref:Uncharacterized protein n=1 Tax=Serratia fonticola TaxID=47917 RepID=A0AAW3WLC2_SERFO|nr:hypothetical protein [Serratia fonticola]MBC3211372.1 hypothetical protein [Serratia fonticola]NYA12354.1 hypothetical protein [Serratia fonticola]NYA31933.1 hypothetical protein [Serratia fonticola]
MNLLEAFYYTFAADASALDRGLSDSEREANKLKDTVSATDAAAEKLGTSFVSLAKSAVGLLGVGLTLGGLKALALTTAENTSELGKQARQMNVNVSTLDAWRKAVEESGGDANAFTNTLGNMAQRFRDPEAALLRYSKALGGMSSFRAQRLGKMIGLDEGTIELLRKGKVSVEELVKKQKEQGVITKQQVEMTDKFNKDLRVLSMSFNNIKTEIGMMLIPVMQYLLDKWNGLSKWASENKGPLGDVFMVVAGIVTAYYLPAMISAAIATLAATWPIILIGAAIAALALVVADVIGYFRGWDSVTGDLVKKFPWLADVLEGLKTVVMDVWNWLSYLFTDPLGAIEQLAESIIKFPLAAIKDLLDLLFGEGAGQTVFETVAKVASVIWQSLKTLISEVVGLAIAGFKSIENAWKTVKGWFGAGEDEVKAAKAEEEASKASKEQPQRPHPEAWTPYGVPPPTYGAGAYMGGLSSSPITTMNSNSIANSKTNTVSKKTDIKIDNITVETQATDAQGIAQEITGQISSVYHHNNDGMDA